MPDAHTPHSELVAVIGEAFQTGLYDDPPDEAKIVAGKDALDSLLEQLQAAQQEASDMRKAAAGMSADLSRVGGELADVREAYEETLVAAVEWKDQAIAHQQQTIGQLAEIDALNEMCESLREQLEAQVAAGHECREHYMRLEEQVERLHRAIRNAGVKAQVDEALTARYYQAPSPAKPSYLDDVDWENLPRGDA